MAISAPPAVTGKALRYPLALAYGCGALLLGIYLASLAVPLWPLLLLAGLLALALARRVDWQAALLVLICAAALALGSWRYDADAYRDVPGQVGHYIGSSVQLTGLIDSEPQVSGRGENLPVSVQQLSVAGRPVLAGGRILVYYTGPQSPGYGDRVELRGTLQAPYAAPGFDYRTYLARQGIHATMEFPSLRVVSRNNGNPAQRWALGLREQLHRAIERLLPHDEAALLIGILLGAPTRSLGALTAAFVAAGLIHIVAISGLKVALVAGSVNEFCTRLPLRLRWIPTLLVVSAYTLVSGATPSGLRSALMWGLAVLALQLGRSAYVWVSLALVAASMGLWKPLLLWDAGFQLSVVGTAGIVLFTPYVERPLERLRWLPRVIRESLAVTVAAQLATMPIVASSFGQVSLVGPIANGLLLPLLGPIMLLGGLAAVLGAFPPALCGWAAHFCAWLVYPWLWLFIHTVQWLASWPHAALDWPNAPLVVALCYYASLILFIQRWRPPAPERQRQPQRGPLALIAGWPRSLIAGVLLAALALVTALARPPDQPMLWVAGTSDGTLLLLQTPGGQAVLVDGGSNPTTTQALLGAHLPFTQRDLTALLVTEPDIGHVGGLLGLQSLYPASHVFDPGAIYPSISYARWRAELRDLGVPETKARTGQRLDLGNGVAIDVLLPTRLSLDDVVAPTAYRLHLGRLAVLVLNNEALGGVPELLQAAGACLDVLVLPQRADPVTAADLVRALHPRLVVLPDAGRAGRRPLRSADLAPLPSGTRVVPAAAGMEIALRDADGTCARYDG